MSPYSKDKPQASPSKSIYELVKQDIKMPEGLLFRGKYVGKTRNNLGIDNYKTAEYGQPDNRSEYRSRVNS